MGQSIDNRIVKMEFDNSNFESKARQTMETLGTLEDALQLKNGGKGLEGLKESLGNVDMTSLLSAAELVSTRLSTLGIIGVTALQNITNAAINAGTQLVKSLSVDQITAGYSEYELKMNSVNTIMASTGESVETVGKYLEELNLYADKTIYSFSDMTSNIGKFTNAGIELDVAVAAMQGISNWAAVAGANANEASRAMYNISQSLAGGYVNLLDWKSVKFANMATQDVMKNMVEVAKVMGTVKENADGTFTSITKNAQGKNAEALSLQQLFNEGLNFQWLSNDVFMKAMELYSTDVRTMTEAEKDSYKFRLKYVNASKEQLQVMMNMSAEEAEAYAKANKIKAGFDDKMIDSFMELSVKANDSATVVKTFSQLMDTLKEGVGSSWSTTFELLFGNLEEAKKLWTSINDVVGGFISKVGDSRNEALKTWRALGGYEVTIDALVSIIKSLGTIISEVGKAFKNVFDGDLGVKLRGISAEIKFFAKNLEPTEDSLKTINTIATAIFSAVDIGFKSVRSIVEIVKNFLSYFDGLGNSLLDLFLDLCVGITDFDKNFQGFDKTINKVLDSGKNVANYFNLFVKRIIEDVQMLFLDLKEKKELFDTFGDFISSVLGDIIFLVGDLLGLDYAKVDSFVTKLWSGIDGITGALVNVKNLVKNIFSGDDLELGDTQGTVDNVVKVLNWFFDAMKQIGAAIKPFADELKANFKLAFGDDLTLSNIIKMILDGTLIVGMVDTITQLKNVLDPLGDIGDMIGNIREDLEIAMKGLNAKYLMTIAGSILMIAAALLLIASIDGDKLTSAMVTVTALVGEMIGMVKAFSSINLKSFLAFGKIGTLLLKLSGAILILGVALKIIASIPREDLIEGMIAITVLMGEMIAVNAILQKLEIKKMTKGMGEMILLAAAMLIMAESVKKLGELDPLSLIKGITAMGALMLEMAIFAQLANGTKIGVGTALSLILLAEAIKLLIVPAKEFASMEWEELGKAAAGIAGILAIYEIFMILQNYASPSLSAAVGLIAIAAAMNLLMVPVRELSQMALTEIGVAVLGLGALLVVIEAFSLIASGGNLLLAGIGLIAFAAALNMMIEPIKILCGIPWQDLLKADLAIGGLLLVIGAFSLTGPMMLVAGAGLLVFAAGLTALMIPLGILAKMSIGTVLKVIGAMVLITVQLTLMSIVLTVISPLLLVVGAALIFFGEGVLLASAGILLFGAAMGLAAAGIEAMAALGIPTIVQFGQAIVALVVTIVDALPGIVLGLKDTIIAFCQLIIESLPQIYKLVKEIIIAITKLLNKSIPEIVGIIGTLIESLLNLLIRELPVIFETIRVALVELCDFLVEMIPVILNVIKEFWKQLGEFLVEMIPQVVGYVIDLVDALLDALTKKLPALVDKGMDLIIALIEGIANAHIKLIRAAFETMITFINGLADAITEYGPELHAAVTKLINAIVDYFFDGIGSIVDIGLNIVEGIVTGIYNNVFKVVQAAENLCNSIWDKIVNFFDIHSPSRRTAEAGKFIDLGLASGIIKNTDTVVDSAESMANKTADAIQNSFSRIMDDTGLINPVITPELNLTKLQKEAKDISSIFEDRNINGSLEGGLNSNQNGGSKSISFVQNNYSPKPLSRTEIYRQTKNQFAALGGVL